MLLFGGIDPTSAASIASNLPMAIQEMVLASWLILRGFDRSAIDSLTVGKAGVKTEGPFVHRARASPRSSVEFLERSAPRFEQVSDDPGLAVLGSRDCDWRVQIESVVRLEADGSPLTSQFRRSPPSPI